MIQLQNDALVASFPEVHASAKLTIDLHRTLRIPDDGTTYSLPPGLGRFPVRLIDDFAATVPESWLEHGGVMLPMYQAEALWLGFSSGWVGERQASYPFAIKIAAGKINAITGDSWCDKLRRRPQDYLVAPEQPWIDGFCVEEGLIRQFVAMPLGAGYSAEEQLTDEAEFGGLQLLVMPMKREVFERRFPKKSRGGIGRLEDEVLYSQAPLEAAAASVDMAMDMGLAPGGRMRQEIFDDPFDFDDWDRENVARCFVHLANSMVWRAVTGVNPPTVPPTAKEYTKAGLPWFEYYSDGSAVEGSSVLARLKSVVQMGKDKHDVPLPENESVTPERIIEIRKGLASDQIREGSF